MYEFFEHTADLGLRVRAPDLKSLFEEAGRGLMSMIIDNPEEIRLGQEVSICIDGSETDYLLFDWLNELLYRFDGEGLLFGDFNVELHPTGLKAIARGEQLTTDRHQLSREVKAITYHQFQVEQTADGWQAELIVDI